MVAQEANKLALNSGMDVCRGRHENRLAIDKLPAAAQEYLRFQERESGARIGMVSTGPDRDQTMVLPEFAAALDDIHG